MLEKLLLEAAVAELETPGLHMRGAQQKPPGVLVSKKKNDKASLVKVTLPPWGSVWEEPFAAKRK